ncbi:hypothetical protein HMPREF3263_07775 [Haemophilus sp. HMSC61B11]|jgi:membrane protein|uniref:hypothetical protein n=1 Tax=Haemophilus sp. HMSC61B11 TaxID=1608882 RepID=UPI0008A98CC7|nr:hypothetical protein [Haemophilus sp. HMSC61B11]OHR65638.1 hypothetical protein HMPREF3263_07775 [Haemophilus sp. HMSC61B11]
MFSNDKSENKKINIIETFLRQYLPLMSVFSSVFGIGVIWFYLRNIDRLDIFTQINFSAYGVISIALFFLLFFFYFFLPFFMIEFINFIKPTTQFINSLEPFARRRVKILYAINQPKAILLILVLFWMYNINDYDDKSKCFIIFLTLILIVLILMSYVLSFDVCRDDFKKFDRNSFLYSFLFLISFKILYEISENDFNFFILILIYLFSLFLSNCIISLSGKNKYRFLAYMMFLTIVLIVFFHSHEFKLQRMILSPVGIVQSPSQSGWYLLKNGDFLELIENNKFKKRVKTINERTYTYINGYLILNVGNVRVICPHDFESKDNKKSDTNRLDFSRCLNLTSEDIKFMKKGFPRNNENVAQVVVETVMKIDQLIIVKSCKKTENHQN